MLGKTSLGNVGLVVGGVLSVVGFVAYAQGNATLNLAGMFYGVPILLGGLALKAAELKPVPYRCPPSATILQLREQQATPTQQQIRKDVTRYRYGQSAHLDDALERLGLAPTDEECPELVAIAEEEMDGQYALTLEFYSPLVALTKWQEKEEKLTRFFGPGIVAQVHPLETSDHLALILRRQQETVAQAG